jgi:myo-inositol-1-phosphate synthase
MIADVMSVDWQFVVVSIAALGALVVLVRRIVPARKRGAGRPVAPACAHCASHPDPSAPPRPARTATTPVVLLRDLRK